MQSIHLSDSTLQNEIEKNILDFIKDEFNCEFSKRIDNLNYQPDFFNEERKIIGEIYTSADLKGSRKHKITADCFKMIAIEKELGGNYKKYVIVDENVKRSLESEKGWRKNAMELFGIELRIFNITEEDKQKLKEARQKQQQGMKILNKIKK